MKKKKKKKRKYLLLIPIVIIGIILLMTIGKEEDNPFIGIWISEGGTIYEFKKRNKGIVTVPLAKYKFKYKIKDNILTIDYEDEKAIDMDYEYAFTRDKLIIKSENGKYILKRN